MYFYCIAFLHVDSSRDSSGLLALKTETEVCALGFGDHTARYFIHVLVVKFCHVLYYALENIANKGINFCILPKTCFFIFKNHC